MKNIVFRIICFAAAFLGIMPVTAQLPQQETLDRGVVAIKESNGVYISWRYLSSDNPEAGFNIYRDGTKLNSEPITASTTYTDSEGTLSSTYVIKRVDYNRETDTSAETSVWPDFYKKIPLNRPASGVTPPYTVTNGAGDSKVTEEYPDGQFYSYLPNSCSVGDVDGDKQYEIIVKWDPTNLRDNSLYGYTGEVILDCYKLDGTQLWRINLGKNIRAGAHYTQFMVYDLDGDGKAEVACKTAPGTIDGQGKAVLMGSDKADADYRSRNGMIIKGSEYLTVFNGETGAEITTIAYNPPRDTPSAWGSDNYGNRSERYLACIAYLDGVRPSLVMCRGYYERTALAAYDFDGEKLTQLWLHDSKTPGEGAYGQGNHNLSVADVDEDGCDEIIYGACAFDQDGSLLYRTGFGHGDAMHVSDLDPDIPGLEVFSVHEEVTAPYGYEIHDAATGKLLYGKFTGSDVGRGVAADLDPNYRGKELCTREGGVLSCKGKLISGSVPVLNFRTYWNGDLQDEVQEKGIIYKWNPSKKRAEKLLDLTQYGNATHCAVIKYTPNIQADIIGDWREEVVLWDKSDSSSLVLFTSTTPTQYRIPTLMHDHVYRMGVAWQNVAYNQPPHLGYYIGDGDLEHARLSKVSRGARHQSVGVHIPIDTIKLRWDRCDGVELNNNLPSGILSRYDDKSRTISFFGAPSRAGNYQVVVSTYGNAVRDITDTLTFEVLPEETITPVLIYTFDQTEGITAKNAIYGEATASGFVPEWESGHNGNAITFPTTADSSSILTQSSYPKLNELTDKSFTISMWVKASRSNQCLLNIEGDNGAFIRIEKGTLFTFSISDGTTTSKATVLTTPFLNNEWNFLTFIRDRADKRLYIYNNTSRLSQGVDNSGDLTLSTIAVGNRTDGNKRLTFRGMLDDLIISTGAMNERQMKEVYTKGYASTEEAISTTDYEVFPTRFTDQLQVRLHNNVSGTVAFTLYNAAGSVVSERAFMVDGSPALIISGLDNLPAGLYTLLIDNGTTRKAMKLVK